MEEAIAADGRPILSRLAHDLIIIAADDGFDAPAVPQDRLAIRFSLSAKNQPATFEVSIDLTSNRSWDLQIFAPPDELASAIGWAPGRDVFGAYYLPLELRGIVLEIATEGFVEPARAAYRFCKAVELLCQTASMLGRQSLIRYQQSCFLTYAEAARVMRARDVIRENWSQRLTLDRLARAVGLNRAKLTFGFRSMLGTTVHNMILHERLSEAARRLLTTDDQISTIAHGCGYGSAASFTRAFTRAFGCTPSHHRETAISSGSDAVSRARGRRAPDENLSHGGTMIAPRQRNVQVAVPRVDAALNVAPTL